MEGLAQAGDVRGLHRGLEVLVGVQLLVEEELLDHGPQGQPAQVGLPADGIDPVAEEQQLQQLHCLGHIVRALGAQAVQAVEDRKAEGEELAGQQRAEGRIEVVGLAVQDDGPLGQAGGGHLAGEAHQAVRVGLQHHQQGLGLGQAALENLGILRPQKNDQPGVPQHLLRRKIRRQGLVQGQAHQRHAALGDVRHLVVPQGHVGKERVRARRGARLPGAVCAGVLAGLEQHAQLAQHGQGDRGVHPRTPAARRAASPPQRPVICRRSRPEFARRVWPGRRRPGPGARPAR
jgi:hypothetical protein